MREMAQKFKLKELQKIYGSRRSSKEISENTQEELLVTGKNTLEKLQKLSYLKGLRSAASFTMDLHEYTED
jgi:hypothetical protein